MINKVLIALLLLNIGFFTWTFIENNNAPKRPPQSDEGIPTITLLPRDNNVGQRGSSSGPISCFTLGPFANLKSAKLVANRINIFGLQTALKKQDTMQTLNFLVYLEPFASREAANAAVAEIRKHEVKDYKILDKEPYKNAVALGYFSDLNKARRHAEYIRFLGYDARYTTQQKRQILYWINFDEPLGKNIPVLNWAKAIAPRSTPQKIPKSCDES